MSWANFWRLLRSQRRSIEGQVWLYMNMTVYDWLNTQKCWWKRCPLPGWHERYNSLHTYVLVIDVLSNGVVSKCSLWCSSKEMTGDVILCLSLPSSTRGISGICPLCPRSCRNFWAIWRQRPCMPAAFHFEEVLKHVAINNSRVDGDFTLDYTVFYITRS